MSKPPNLPSPRRDEQRVWSAVRQWRRFTVADIAGVSECSPSMIGALLRKWRRYGLVHRDNDGWRLARDLGPLPPYDGGRTLGLLDRQTRRPLERSASSHPSRPRRKAVSEEERRERNREYKRRSRARRRAQLGIEPKARASLKGLTPEQRKAHARQWQRDHYLGLRRDPAAVERMRQRSRDWHRRKREKEREQ